MSDQYYPFYQGDYLKDTDDLTLVEHGAYHLLLHHYYAQEFLPSDIDRLRRICRAFTPEECAAIDTIVARYFKRNGHANLINDRAEEEIAKRRAFRETQAKKAKAGAAARWGKKPKPEEMLEAMPGAMPEAPPETCPKDPPPSLSPSLRKKGKTHTGENFQLPEWMPEETWSVFLSHRKAVKAPITQKAYPAFIEKFLRLKLKGWPPKEVVDVMIEKGWRWFKPEWVQKDRMRQEFGEKTTRTIQNLQDWMEEEDKNHDE
jgi:uncharacterized protein YdaU (DUF1376 family)